MILPISKKDQKSWNIFFSFFFSGKKKSHFNSSLEEKVERSGKVPLFEIKGALFSDNLGLGGFFRRGMNLYVVDVFTNMLLRNDGPTKEQRN